VFVLDFDGDIKASATESLRHEITALLTLATPKDEVVLRLESGGGMVHSYGLASSQLARIREAGVPLTVCIDKVAASGGYMMACIGEKIISAPFAILGSIGVVAQLPNVNRLLKKHDIDFEVLTAGEYKRTLTVFGENTEKGGRSSRKTWTSPINCSRTSSRATARNWLSTKWPPVKSGWVSRHWKSNWWTN
jgi:serine protease SohB